MNESAYIGQYQILEELYHGPISTIYKAYQPSLERTILIKKLHQKLVEEVDIRDRFAREAQVCAKINHPNIVEVFDFHASPEATYLVLEYVEGKDLRDLMSGKSLPLEVAFSIMHQILAGLAYAHEKGITHRDLKPSNILISQDGGVKISDFGLAMIEGLGGLTQQGSVVGTPAYMSPEQAGGKKIDNTTDIFSLGVTFFEMLSGGNVYKSETFSDFYRKIMFDPVPNLADYRDDLPPQLAKLLNGMMEKNPGKRIRSAGEILTALEEIAKEELLQLGRETVKQFYRQRGDFTPSVVRAEVSSTQRRLRKKKRAVIALPGLALLLTVLVIVALQFESRQEPVTQLNTVDEQSSADDSILSEFIDTVQMSAPLESGKENISGNKPDSPPAANNVKSEAKTEANISESAPNELAAKLPEIPPADIQGQVSTEPGILLIGNKNWSYVFLDGDSLGQTPIYPMRISPGWHKMSFIRPKLQISISCSIEVKSGQEIQVDLTNYIAFLNVSTGEKGAELWIDGKYKGQTPIENVMVELGERKIELKNKDYRSYEEILKFDNPGDTIKLMVPLEPSN